MDEHESRSADLTGSAQPAGGSIEPPGISSSTVGALAIALASAFAAAVAYGMAYLHELGYASVYYLPIGLIQIVPLQLITSLLGLLALGAFALNWASIGRIVSRSSVRGPVADGVFNLATPALVVVLTAYVYADRLQEVLPVALVLPLLLTVEFLLPLISQRKVPGYRAKLRAQDAVDRAAMADGRALISSLARRFPSPALVLLITLAGGWLAYSQGRAEALGEQSFSVVSGKPAIAVLRAYGLTVVGIPLDDRGRPDNRRLVVMLLGPGQTLTFTHHELGHLYGECHQITVGC